MSRTLHLRVALTFLIAASSATCDAKADEASATAGAEIDTPTKAEIDQALERARAEERAKSEAERAAAEQAKAEAEEPALAFEPDDAPSDPDVDLLEGLSMLQLRSLSETHRERITQLLQSIRSACGQSHSLLTSLRSDPGCVESEAISQFVVDNVRRGQDDLAIKKKAAELTRELQPHPMSVGGRPVYGNPRAPVTIVVFADFQCPHCAMEAPRLRRAVDDSGGKAKLVYKHYPLRGHDLARKAAGAAEAVFAQKPDAFWDFNAWVFSNQRELFADPEALDAKLRARAQKLGINLARYDGFVRAGRGDGTVTSDHSDGRRAGVTSTPAVFVNGRHVSADLFRGSISKWVDFALRADR